MRRAPGGCGPVVSSSRHAGKVALVSGCSTGIGRHVADQLARGGFTVAAGARDPSTLQDLAGAHPGRLRPVAWDVADPASTEAAVLGTLRELGRIDLLVNNAGYGQMGPVLELSREQWRRQLETNVIGMADASALAARAPGGMIARRSGRIVNVGSIVGLMTFPFGGAYCASKHAVEALSDALRMELAPFGIQVVLAEPGPVISRFGETARRSVEAILTRKESPYEYLRDSIEERTRASQRGGMATQACAGRIVRAATMASPPARMRITWQAHLAFLARRILPSRLFDALIRRQFRLDRPAPGPPPEGPGGAD